MYDIQSSSSLKSKMASSYRSRCMCHILETNLTRKFVKDLSLLIFFIHYISWQGYDETCQSPIWQLIFRIWSSKLKIQSHWCLYQPQFPLHHEYPSITQILKAFLIMLSPSREAVNFFKVENPSSLLKNNLQSKVILFQQSFYSVFRQH